MRLFAIRTLAYLTNYVFCHIPSFALRRFWYTRVLGVRMASGAGIHLNCFIWFYGPGQMRRGGLAIGRTRASTATAASTHAAAS